MSDSQPLAAHQNLIYREGREGRLPTLPLAVEDLEHAAMEAISPEAYGYVAGGAGSESTVLANLEAFEKWRIVPRVLRDVSKRDLRCRVLNTEMPWPVMLAPIGVQSIVHPEGEKAVARAARALGMPMCLSTASTSNIEEIAFILGDTPKWYQLYWPRDPRLAKSFLQRAERAGYEAVVVTLDTKILAWRERDLEYGYLPFLKGEGIGNYISDPVFREGLESPPEKDMAPAIRKWGTLFAEPAHTWADLAYLRECTKLPIVLKGIQHPEDARLAVQHGMDGIVVSNHGGRQVDGAIASLDTLPGIVDAVKGRMAVLFDSGIRRGADVFKAMAIGADAVLLGRPYMWALALGGQEGVEEYLRRFLADVDLTLALSGHTSFKEVTRDALVAAE